MKKLTLIITMSLFVFNMNTNAQSYTSKTYTVSKLGITEQVNDLKIWKNIYQKYFNIEIDITNIVEKKDKWPIVVTRGMKIQTVFDALPFKKWKYIEGNLDRAVPVNNRTSNKGYVTHVNKNIEADEQFKGKSVDDLKKINHKGITLLERLLLELYYFEKTGDHLDLYRVTYCSGSRFQDGNVPIVDWFGNRLRVSWYRASYSRNKIPLCSREVFYYQKLKF